MKCRTYCAPSSAKGNASNGRWIVISGHFSIVINAVWSGRGCIKVIQEYRSRAHIRRPWRR
jgi:hypothetical protein